MRRLGKSNMRIVFEAFMWTNLLFTIALLYALFKVYIIGV